jgi:hypothetical protein
MTCGSRGCKFTTPTWKISWVFNVVLREYNVLPGKADAATTANKQTQMLLKFTVLSVLLY